MLKPLGAASLALALWSASLPARAAPAAATGAHAESIPARATGSRQRPRPPQIPRAIREPVRLTAGAAGELMGVLSPDERTLYFVTDADGTLDIMRQSPIQSGPVSVSAGFGDAAWPELSPDGTHIAYISFERDSTGDVCIRGVGEREGEDERCWPQAGSAELVVLWWDSSSLAVLSRESLHGDYQLVLQAIEDERPPRRLFARNMVGLALSPDRRWLAYVPLDKTTREVGITFSQRTAAARQRPERSCAGVHVRHAPTRSIAAGTRTNREAGRR